ncbi:hypothetical protein DERP_000450 [Dermatophagoides pteronyssinus]|uniref:Uncharacterized protein n=1 Tax=Dermatophagoides pteronyssinus TaxID=6956 RepID=A0ABQ8J072_DERPT|nr:hypothetical protein DERP_000450 [Dermatophagoides pteronyssinus]
MYSVWPIVKEAIDLYKHLACNKKIIIIIITISETAAECLNEMKDSMMMMVISLISFLLSCEYSMIEKNKALTLV